jgi:excisionase family DNA binding protein
MGTLGYMKPHLVTKESKKLPIPVRSEVTEFLSEQQLCQRLGVGVTTLRRWRWQGREMPTACRLGRLVRYHRAEVDRWIERVVAGELKAGSRKPELVS